MSWRHVEVSSQRVSFVQEAVSGLRSLAVLCEEYGISRPTGYLWVKRYRESGLSGIAERSRKPLHSPGRSSAELEGRIEDLRRLYPEWGARKLQWLLEKDGVNVPVATVHRILKRRGLVHPLDRHRKATGSFCRERPNQLWQMDFKSPKGWGTHIGPLSVLDDHSRYAVALEHLGSSGADGVQQRLDQAFRDCGLPDAMLMDHGTPWWNMQSAGGWTQLSVWLMRLSIRLYFSGYSHPQTQGKVERFHRSLEMARRRRVQPEKGQEQAWLDSFRYEYNHIRPHQALEMATPASRWKASLRPFTKPLDPVYPADAEVYPLNSNGSLRLDKATWQVAGALAGQLVRIQRIDHRALVFYGATLIRELDLAGHGSTIVEPCPANFLNL
ncbi:IS481 family transposase [Granulicella mallensis]|uniref:Integrase catalytic region n=1 Tax=Granulicella mallensis (strain ATCC BAA-1857 / DSM 23137 / MP5ACTX8) TaxID=682795 RepID=G8NPC5_GRAMM|nr:Integrase catalytic region [Granulicella mallensis MP5ACTX8]AEU37951.1 Integrase catalytic region [Granulicella mallensis MP5ACTX8]